MDWILNNWWVATTVPYLTFNVWLENAIHRESSSDYGYHGRTPLWTGFMWAAGLWVVLGCLAWTLGERLLPLLDPRRLKRPRVSRAFAKRVARAVVMTLGVMFMYVFAVAATGHHPWPGEVWTMWLLSVSVGTLASR